MDDFKERKLTNPSEKPNFNAWYDCGIEGEALKLAHQKIEKDNKNIPQKTEKSDSRRSWDIFYKKHKQSFFRDRKWLTLVFKDLLDTKKTIFEVGCGVGNSLAHLPKIDYACDFSENAVKLAQERFPKTYIFVHDLCSDIPLSFSADYIVAIFTMSAIEPKLHLKVFKKLYNCLNPGGKIFFKDYGFLDMIQLRYKTEQIVDENFYQRKDGTFTYFFKLEYMQKLVEDCGLEIEQLYEDKKLHYNRKRDLDMYRVMIQGIFVKK
ncbi:hypothetical protein EDEG_01186 [Edhazardia aedis USNM 41457]|uniref:tRNA N(3)-methylcytidine methyltransferase n=1 Tax=Edhazardia aedis (strain USNM 41457) TaxID=1003232 RepID=J9DTK3_EDHAE|nr:hypothetical protein EDEG_01186 [Edhazardia aedis USNM 41457]|eukprot:EJW04602.1 hypothetical protein EDEG_01186 [Edhazardia aedis USNM 41457]